MRRARLHWAAWLYLWLVLIFMLAPILFIVVNSFNEARFSTFPPPGFSLQWYVKLIAVEDFRIAFRNSVIIAAWSTLLALLIGTAASLAMVRGRSRRRGLWQAVMLSPLLVPKIIIGIAIFAAAIRAALYPSFTSIVLAHTVLLLPYVVSILVANLHQVQRAQEEAAMDLGANAWQTFRLATVPQIGRGILLAAVFGFVLSFDEFDISLFLVRADNMTLPIRMYLYMQELEDPTLAALSTVLIAVSILAVFLILQIARGSQALAVLRRKGPP